MNTNDMFGFMDMIFLVAALYMGYQWYMMKFRGQINRNYVE